MATHHELLQTSPIYQDIYRSQFGTEDPNLLYGDHLIGANQL